MERFACENAAQVLALLLIRRDYASIGQELDT